MGIIVRQDENRSELQKRIAAELSEKAKKKHDPSGGRPDGVEDSAYMKDTKQTTNLAWLWILLVIGGVVAAVWYYIAQANQSGIPY